MDLTLAHQKKNFSLRNLTIFKPKQTKKKNSQQLIRKFKQPQQTAIFRDLVKGEERHDICRNFIAALQLVIQFIFPILPSTRKKKK